MPLRKLDQGPNEPFNSLDTTKRPTYIIPPSTFITMTNRPFIRFGVLSLLLTGLLFGCEESASQLDEPLIAEIEQSVLPDTIMKHTMAQVKEARQQSGLDQRAMAIEGVLSVGISGNSNDDAWIQVLVKDDTTAQHASKVLGDSLNGIPIKYAYSDTVRAQ